MKHWRLPGAYVVLSWTVVVPAPGHAVDSCRYAEPARTDETGTYVMEGPNFITAGLASAAYSVYSPGLAPIAFPYGGSEMSPKDITMALSKEPPESRLSRLSMFSEPGCPGGDKLNDPRKLRVEHIAATLRQASGLDHPQTLRAVPYDGGKTEAATPR